MPKVAPLLFTLFAPLLALAPAAGDLPQGAAPAAALPADWTPLSERRTDAAAPADQRYAAAARNEATLF